MVTSILFSFVDRLSVCVITIFYLIPTEFSQYIYITFLKCIIKFKHH